MEWKTRMARKKSASNTCMEQKARSGNDPTPSRGKANILCSRAPNTSQDKAKRSRKSHKSWVTKVKWRKKRSGRHKGPSLVKQIMKCRSTIRCGGFQTAANSRCERVGQSHCGGSAHPGGAGSGMSSLYYSMEHFTAFVWLISTWSAHWVIRIAFNLFLASSQPQKIHY